MSLPRYKNCRDSGVSWLGEAPSHWETKRLRFVARLNPSKSEIAALSKNSEVSFLPMEAVGDDGSLNLDRTRPIGEVENGYSYFRNGDVTFAKITPCFENGKGAVMRGLTGGIGFGTTELTVVRPRVGATTSGYLHWVFISTPFRKRGEASMYGAGGQKRVPEDFVRDFSIAFPPLEEQRAIERFLERETAKIDALIAQQERLFELLKEKRQVEIANAVTKGLNSHAPMKSSGLTWLGMVPAKWSPISLGKLFRPQKRQDFSDKEVLSVYRDYGVIRKDSRTDNFNKTPEDLSSYQLVEPNDLVVNKMKAWQGSLGISRLEGITSPDYIVFTPRHRELPDYLHLLLRSQPLVSVYRSISNGIRPSQWRLEPDSFLALHIFLPPLNEQRAILEFIDALAKRIDALIAEAQSAVELLSERRAALISAAVTGKIDVRGLTATQPEREVAA